jgi:hypothetical protein
VGSGVGVKRASMDRSAGQGFALSDKPGTPARSADICRLTFRSIVKRSRTSFALLIRREWLEELSAATTRRL